MVRLPRTPKLALAACALLLALIGLQSLAVAKLPAQDRQVPPRTLRVFTHHTYAKLFPRKAATRTSSSTSKDTDHEGLSDWTEVNRTRTTPRKADTAGDGFKDGTEVTAGSNPLDPKSVPQPAQP